MIVTIILIQQSKQSTASVEAVGEGVTYFEDGDRLTFVTVDRKATNSIRYHTIGFIVGAKKIDVTSSKDIRLQLNGNYVELGLKEFKYSSTPCNPDGSPGNGGYLRTKYELFGVRKKIANIDDVDSDTFYFQPIMSDFEGSKQNMKGPFYSCPAWENAYDHGNGSSWAPDAKDHYNHGVKIVLHKIKQKYKLKTPNGTVELNYLGQPYSEKNSAVENNVEKEKKRNFALSKNLSEPFSAPTVYEYKGTQYRLVSATAYSNTKSGPESLARADKTTSGTTFSFKMPDNSVTVVCNYESSNVLEKWYTIDGDETTLVKKQQLGYFNKGKSVKTTADENLKGYTHCYTTAVTLDSSNNATRFFKSTEDSGTWKNSSTWEKSTRKLTFKMPKSEVEIRHYYKKTTPIRLKINFQDSDGNTISSQYYDGSALVNNITKMCSKKSGTKMTVATGASKLSVTNLNSPGSDSTCSLPSTLQHDGKNYVFVSTTTYEATAFEDSILTDPIKTGSVNFKVALDRITISAKYKQEDVAPVRMKLNFETADGTPISSKYYDGSKLVDSATTLTTKKAGVKVFALASTEEIKATNLTSMGTKTTCSFPKVIKDGTAEYELISVSAYEAVAGSSDKKIAGPINTGNFNITMSKSRVTLSAKYKLVKGDLVGVRMRFKLQIIDKKGSVVSTSNYYYNGTDLVDSATAMDSKATGTKVTFSIGTSSLKKYEYPKTLKKDGKTYKLVSASGYLDGSSTPTVKEVKSGTFSLTVPKKFCTAIATYKAEDDGKQDDVDTSTSTGSYGTLKVDDYSMSSLIKADDRDNEQFDVSKGIPSSEDLYVNATTKEFLYEYKYKKVTKTVSESCTVSQPYTASWEVVDEPAHTETKNGKKVSVPATYKTQTSSGTKSKSYTFKYKYTYYTLESLSVYKLDQAVFTNGALPNGTVTTKPVGYTAPVATYKIYSKSDRLVVPKIPSSVTLPNKSVTGSGSRPSAPEISDSEAKSAILSKSDVKLSVRNDSLILNGKKLLDDKVVSKSFSSSKTEIEAKAPAPTGYGEVPKTNRDVLYKKGITIKPTQANGFYKSDNTVFTYKSVKCYKGEESDLTFDTSCNTVVVLTPVVCYPTLSDAKKYCQLVSVDNSKKQLVLGEDFTIDYPYSGQHVTYKGYGNRNYKKYTTHRCVKFPFDVAYEGKTIPGNNWISLEGNKDKFTFTVPEWVTEGAYTIQYKTVPINGTMSSPEYKEFNFQTSFYCAVNSCDVWVSGRVYGLKLYDVADYPLWEKVFRTKKGSNKLSGKNYSVGTRNRNGVSTSRNSLYTFPMMTGKHPTAKTMGLLKTGYNLRFTLKTIGSMDTKWDSITITPTFYYVSKDGKTRQEVDVYYGKTINNKYQPLVKLSSKSILNNKNKRYYTLGYSKNAIPIDSMKKTASLLGITYDKFRGMQSDLGTLDSVTLPYSVRLFTGTSAFSGVSADTILKSGQSWFFDYALPSSVHVVKKGTDLASYYKKHSITFKEKFWLTDGYLVMNFKIRTYRNGKANLDYYNVDHGCLNEWKTEGAVSSYSVGKATFSLKDGDIAFFDLKKSAGTDYTSGGTH